MWGQRKIATVCHSQQRKMMYRAADRSSMRQRLIAPGPCGELLYAVRANS